jgi:hypothetical protein
VIHSPVAICNQLGVEPFTYLRDMLPRLLQTPAERHGDLLPAAWAHANREAAPKLP